MDDDLKQSHIEIIARALCGAAGRNPDASEHFGHPVWTHYEGAAERILASIRRPPATGEAEREELARRAERLAHYMRTNDAQTPFTAANLDRIAALLRSTSQPAGPPPLVARSIARAKRDIDEMDAAIGGKAPTMLEDPTNVPISQPAGPAPGWRCVPEEPTEAMMHACKGALRAFLQPIPKDVRAKMFREMRHGLPSNGVRVPWRLKTTLRYKAMLAAAPLPLDPPKEKS